MAKRLTMKVQTKMTLAEGVEEFILNCEARNLRPGTIKHYKDSVKQIYKVVPPVQIPQELRIRSRGTERHSASN